MIYLSTTDRQTVNDYTRADLFRFKHTINDENTFENVPLSNTMTEVILQ